MLAGNLERIWNRPEREMSTYRGPGLTGRLGGGRVSDGVHVVQGSAEFRLLGPVEARIDGRRADIGHARQRSVLAVLLADANTVVPPGRVAERVWGQDVPETATGLVYGYVSRLRRRLTGVVSLVRVPEGYRLEAEPESIDLHRFRHMVAKARTAGDDARAASLLADALALWRGAAFTGLTSPWLEHLRRALEHERLAATIDHFEVQLRLGRDAGVLGDLRELLACQPFDERAAGLFMRAAHGSGRRAEALECYHLLRSRLVDELGVEPGAPLQKLFCQLLRDDPALTGRRGSPQRPLPVPAQLPHDVARFAGRAAELAALDHLLAGGKAGPAGQAMSVSAVDGAAGVGKTALAVHWAHRVVGHFPDGQLFANLCGFEARHPAAPGEILGRFLRALGVGPQNIPAEVEEQAALYRSLLTGKRVLVVLDNALNSGQVRPLLPGSSGCLALVTSRKRLGGLVALDGACQLTLEPLASEEALALLTQVAGTSRVAAEQDAARQICELCGFLPLTVRMAAARAVARPRRRLAELAEELARPGQRLALTSGDEPTIRDVLSWSCRALDPEAARLFRLLGLYPRASISTPCAAVLAGIPEASAQRQLQALAGAHLLEDDGHDRYRLPALLRLYAAERSHDEPGPQRADALGRMLAWYLHTAAAASQILAPRPPLSLAPPPPGVLPLPLHDQAQALAWFEAERPSIVAATSQAADAGQHTLAWQLPIACWDFFYRRKHLADWLATSTVALASAQQAGDRYGQGWAWQSLGDAYQDMRQFSEAISHLQQALAIRHQIGDRPGEGWALGNLGECHFHQRNYARALSFYQQAAATQRDAGDQWGLAISLTNAGEASRNLGRPGDAFAACQQALGIHRQIGDQHSEAWTLNNLASLHQRERCWAEALGHARQALAIQADIDDQWGQSITLTNLAGIHDATGQPAQAIERYQRALTIQRHLADQHAQAQTLTRLARILQRARQPDAARSCLRQASDLSNGADDRDAGDSLPAG